MKKLTLLIAVAVTVMMVTSCGQKKGPAPAEYLSVEEWVELGWQKYAERDYEAAKAAFDSALVFEADHVEANLGAGWSRIHLEKYDDAQAKFDIAIAQEGVKPISMVVGGNLIVLDSVTLAPPDTPMLGLMNYVIKAKEIVEIDTTVVIDTLTGDTIEATIDTVLGSPHEFNVVRFTPYRMYVEPEADTLYVDAVPLRFEVDYAYYKGGGTIRQGDAFAGKCTGYMLQEDYISAVITGNVVFFIPGWEYFDKDSVHVNRTRLHVLMAQIYYRMKFYLNALDEIQKADPTWEPPEPSDPDFLYKLQEKIEELLGRS